jgi:hypothetical protein
MGKRFRITAILTEIPPRLATDPHQFGRCHYTLKSAFMLAMSGEQAQFKLFEMETHCLLFETVLICFVAFNSLLVNRARWPNYQLHIKPP